MLAIGSLPFGLGFGAHKNRPEIGAKTRQARPPISHEMSA
jgi:hypothetical protein